MDLSQEQLEAALSDHAFFGGLTSEERAALIDLGQIREAEANTILFQHGDPYRGFYLLLEGTIQIYRLSPEGRMLVLHVIRPGESFAEVPLFEEQKDPTYPASAEALDDSTLLFLPKNPFLSFVDENPRTCLHMLGQLAGRLRDAVRQLDAVSLQDVQERLAHHLVTEASPQDEPSNKPPTLTLDVPKSVLAAELGTVPETLSRALRALEEQNLIRSDASQIVLTDVQGLRRVGRHN